MQNRVELIAPQGDPDKAVVDCYRRLHGLPPGAMVWVCQHSCAEETIPDCTAMNCEAALIVDPCDIEVVRALPERQEFAVFDSVAVGLRLAVDADSMSALQALCITGSGFPMLAQSGPIWSMTGSFLAFARLCAVAASPGLTPSAVTILAEIESTLVWQFSAIGPALLRQRFIDLRKDRAVRGNVVMLLARGDFPARALVAWEEPARYTRKKAVMPSRPQANAGFGLWTDRQLCMGMTSSDLYAVPGDLYGPTSRVVFWVDAEVADSVHALCSACVVSQLKEQRADSMLELLTQIVAVLGLPAVSLPVQRGDERSDCVLPARFILRILWAQPLS